MLTALLQEIRLRKKQWQGISFETLYFGGGTPSVLSAKELNRITDAVRTNYSFSEDIEFTLEANPDDLTLEYLKVLKKETAINRLSIGTQSFFDEHLQLMNRRHTGSEAYNSIYMAREEGFENMNIDLIYGVPGLSNQQWTENLSKFIELKVPHLSAYHLSFEPKTVFEHMRKNNKLKPVDEILSAQQYEILVERLKNENYQHYEVSNFAKDAFFSKHNTNYWLGKKYIGIGPSAHSFMGDKRSWNISNNTKYCQALSIGSDDYFTEELLDVPTKYNEYLLTSLRTQWGLDLNYIATNFGQDYADYCVQKVRKFEIDKHYQKTTNGIALTEQGWFISDYIISELFFEK
jgi:oxygen-independent coproporphyrinogen-3 oxidase